MSRIVGLVGKDRFAVVFGHCQQIGGSFSVVFVAGGQDDMRRIATGFAQGMDFSCRATARLTDGLVTSATSAGSVLMNLNNRRIYALPLSVNIDFQCRK
jgi:hypothetical protein